MRRVALVLLAVLVLALPALAKADPPAEPAAAAVASGLDFFQNVKMPCSADTAGPLGCGQLVEPEVTSAPDGTIYVTAQEGVGGGVNLWKRDPSVHTYTQLNKPDGIQTVTRRTGVTIGGGDNDVAISTDGKIYVTSLNLVTATLSTSTDGGKSWLINPIANMEAGVDRQWIAAEGPNTVYMSYHDAAIGNIWLTKSTNAGLTFGPPVSMIPKGQIPMFAGWPLAVRGVLGSGNKTSDLTIDPEGRVGIAFVADDPQNPTFTRHSVFVSITAPGGKGPKVHKVFESAGTDNLVGLFPAIASDLAGNLYVAWTKNQQGVFLSKSTDHGVTWSAPVQVSQGAENAFTVFPHLIAGSDGRVGATWLGSATNDATAAWHTYFAQNLDTVNTPAGFTQVEASGHVVHVGAICLGGLGCNAGDPLGSGGRELAEVVQAGLTQDGRAMIAYPDTSTTTTGWTYVAEQNNGPGFYAGITPTPPAPPGGGSSEDGGPVTDPVTPVGTSTQYLAPGSAGSGVPLLGNELDLPGQVAALSETVPNEGHVASGNFWTTNVGGLNLAFDGAALSSNQLVGGTMNLTTFQQEVLNEAGLTGAFEAYLFDVSAGGSKREIASIDIDDANSEFHAGIKKTEGTYAIPVPQVWEVPAGHHLRLEIDFTCFCSTDMLFYYGKAGELARFTIGTYQRV
jgi:hypothetical protein